MSFSVKKTVLKTFKVTGITFVSLIALMFLIPYLFPQAINRKINQWANSNINGTIAFSKTRLSFFKHFPAFTLTLFDVTLKGSTPFENDTLIAAKEISLGIDISSVFKKKVTINKVFLNDAFINVQVDSAGRANYNIYKSKPATATASNDTGGASLGINKILVENSRIIYNDRSIPMVISARGFNYTGSGDLSKDIFDLNTHLDIKSVDFIYSKQAYVISKKLKADLVTEINTRSLAFIFRKNDLNINDLPVEFNGQFGFLKDGYDMDLNINSHENDLDEIVSALPDEYQKLLDKTEINGTGIIQISLKGRYVVKDSLMPDLSMSFKVRNGYVDDRKEPVPLKNLYIDATAKLPRLNMDSLSVNIDSLYFNVEDGYFSSVLRIRGLKAPYVYARVNSEMDLEKWNNAIGLKKFEVKGKYSLHLLAEGKYATSIVHNGLRETIDTVVTSVPKFKLQSSLRKGYFKYKGVAQAVNNISFNMHADCPDNNYKHINGALDSLDVKALNNYIRGYFRFSNASGFLVDAILQSKFHLEDLKQLYPMDSIDLKGDLDADIQAKGRYDMAKNIYPVVTANIILQNGSVQTKYYPHPIENIQVNTNITDQTGSLKGMHIVIKPVSFVFEDEPFEFKADLNDLTNLVYKVNLKGNLNVGNIYRVFSKKGYNVTGLIGANLSLKGKQSDATAGHYDKLDNKGKLRFKNLTVTTDLYPKPFIISKGVFSFKEEKIKLDTFTVNYANSVFVLNGDVTNLIDYLTKKGTVLKGDLSLQSNLLIVDDFMAFSAPAQVAPSAVAPAPVQPNTSGSTGVVLIPGNLDLNFTADVKTVKYNGILLNNAKGQMLIQHDSILLKETGFDLVGAPVVMNASYTAINPKKAYFSYHINATNLDVKKAYKNIKLFHDLVSSAAHAEGLISLDYQLSGMLNANMMPIYPSLKGGGILSAKKIGMRGFGLFNAIGRETKQDSFGSKNGLSKLAIKTTIANNIITIERTKIRMAGFRLRLEGQASFSKELNLKMRLGLPPLGIIGIPMTITGTGDSPKIHVGKGDNEELKEVADDSDD